MKGRDRYSAVRRVEMGRGSRPPKSCSSTAAVREERVQHSAPAVAAAVQCSTASRVGLLVAAGCAAAVT
eukprot:6209522-Pleurochrysis_carterae.AAC.3